MGEPQERAAAERDPKLAPEPSIEEGMQEHPRSDDEQAKDPVDEQAKDHLVERERSKTHVSSRDVVKPQDGAGARDQEDRAELRQRGDHRDQDAANEQQEARNKAGQDAHDAQRVGPPHEPPEGQKDQKPPRDKQDRSQSELDEKEQQAREQPARK